MGNTPKGSDETYNPGVIQTRYGDGICSMFGIALHQRLEQVEKDKRNAAGLANARLICAAPEMLKRLELTEKFIQMFLRGESLPATWEEMLHDIDGVIAKAKGEA